MRHLVLVALISCAAPKHADRPTIDCTAADQGKLATLLSALTQALAGGGWLAVEQQAIAAGVTYGGCALADMVQGYLSPEAGRAAPSLTDGHIARDTLERFRAERANGAVFHLLEGDL